MIGIQVDKEIKGNSISIRWKLDEKTLGELNDICRDPHYKDVQFRLLIVLTGGSHRKEVRRLALLQDKVQILPLRFPHENTILTRIVYGDSIKKMEEWFLSGQDNVYQTMLVGYLKKEPYFEERPFERSYRTPVLGHVEGESLEIYVPPNIFAKGPSEREKKILGFCFKEEARNQCELRKQKLEFPLCAITKLLKSIGTYILMYILGAAITIWCTIRYLALGFYSLGYNFNPELENIVYVKERRKNYWQRLGGKTEEEKEILRKEKEGREEREFEEFLKGDGVPLTKRIYLRYYDLKGKVCKPYMG